MKIKRDFKVVGKRFYNFRMKFIGFLIDELNGFLLKEKQKQFAEGYNFAFYHHYVDKLPVEVLENITKISKDSKTYNWFDQGIENALKIIESTKAESKDGSL